MFAGKTLVWSAYIKKKGFAAMEEPFSVLPFEEEMLQRDTALRGPTICWRIRAQGAQTWTCGENWLRSTTTSGQKQSAVQNDGGTTKDNYRPGDHIPESGKPAVMGACDKSIHPSGELMLASRTVQPAIKVQKMTLANNPKAYLDTFKGTVMAVGWPEGQWTVCSSLA